MPTSVVARMGIPGPPGAAGAPGIQGPPGPSGTGWITVLDLDLSAEVSQSLSPDGNYTIGGKTWEKVNSTADRVAMAIVHGQGLVIQPTDASTYHDGDRTLPYIRCRLPTIFPTINCRHSIRAWFHIVADTIAADGYPAFENSVNGIDNGSWSTSGDPGSGNNGSGVWMFSALRGVVGGGGSKNITAKRIIATGSVYPFKVVADLGDSNRVQVLEIDHSSGTVMQVLYGAYGSGAWPNLSALLPAATIVDSAAARVENNCPPIASMALFLGACRAGSGSNLSLTIAHVRVDVRE